MLKLVPDHPDDVIHCELCPNTGLDEMYSHGDIDHCPSCHAEVIAETNACEHEWRIEPNDAGDIGVFCEKCSVWKSTASSPVF